ncbi:MAG: PAS domain S-box protein [candidate division Zixibacteria bacterium]|nr:PAS domain S-box protein [candidate division Zixibacteria bacterium]
MKPMQLFWKLGAVLALIITLALATMGYVNNRAEENDAILRAQETALAYHTTVHNYLISDSTHDKTSIQTLARSLAEGNPRCKSFHLISGEGEPRTQTINLFTEPGTDERTVSVSMPAINDEGCRTAGCHVQADVSSVLGLLVTDFPLKEVDDRITRSNQLTLLAIVIAILLSYSITWFLIVLFIKRPMAGLAEAMSQLADKKLDIRVEEDGEDEFGSVASSFNDVAALLSSAMLELHKTQNYLRGILDSSADVVITVNSSGKIRTFNTGAEVVLGYWRMDVIGKPIEMLFADPQERYVAIEKLKFSDNVSNYETQFRTKDGEVRDILLSLSRLRNAAGEVIGTIGIGKDLTEEKRLQKKLVQSQRLAAIGEVFTGIQHSMKNMLNACTGGAYMVRIGLAKDNRKMLEEGWGMVQEGINRMKDMSSDMLKYVKEWKPRPDRIDLSQTLSDIYRVVRETAAGRGIAFELSIAADLPTIVCDGPMIHSAVMDIVSNALDACSWKDYGDDEKPNVEMSARLSEDGQESIIEIKDNGIGMTEEVKADIFTPFFSTKSKAGTGLGLSITSRMINIHKGKIEVESEPNQGALFRIILPVGGTGSTKESSDGKKSSGS